MSADVTTEPRTVEPEVRDVPLGVGACPECDELQQVSYSRVRIGERPKVYTHGPRGNRCPGSARTCKPWLEATRLPTWDELSDLDKGAALLHAWKRKREGVSYAREHYPVRYFDHPALLALDPMTACRHAAVVTGGWNAICDRLGDEVEHLYDAALDADDVRRAS